MIEKFLIMLLIAAAVNAKLDNPDDVSLCSGSDLEKYVFDASWHILAGVICIVLLLAVSFIYYHIHGLRSVHGFMFFYLLFGLLTLYFSLIVINFKFSFIPCAFNGYLLGFTTLFCICWMNVMCLDSFLVFHNIDMSKTKQFTYCCFYGIGGPAIYLFGCFLLNQLELDLASKPPFSAVGCGLKEKTADLYYFYLPSLLLVVASASLLIWTAWRVKHLQRVLKHNTVQFDRSADREKLTLTWRLFVILAFLYGLQYYAWVTESNCWLRFLTSVYVYITGLFIFLICICNRRVYDCFLNLRCLK
ncbi:G-protein coupled receptor Mth-like [Wyeomyia smithii]|uniref:G-protein coupled receptor Mth-like n=1 Tax=Wyeomyia smithii TaxID=174621 RepID=UPI0024680794|nr:G-protein coupled receptor Mth-like [Wyeomyia smithii]XP_055540729.1 G-protein coupled receptor Mth-like [Wyeomyia smithii]